MLTRYERDVDLKTSMASFLREFLYVLIYVKTNMKTSLGALNAYTKRSLINLQTIKLSNRRKGDNG